MLPNNVLWYFCFFNICYSLQFFVTTLIYLKNTELYEKIQTSMISGIPKNSNFSFPNPEDEYLLGNWIHSLEELDELPEEPGGMANYGEAIFPGLQKSLHRSRSWSRASLDNSPLKADV